MNNYSGDQPTQGLSSLTTDTTVASTSELSTTIVSDLPETSQAKLEVIQILLEPYDRQTYGEHLKEGADKHGELLGRPWLTTVIDSYSRRYVECTL